MEYHCNKAADVANRIFEKGLETFKTEPEFVLRYLGFLISINDENSETAALELVAVTDGDFLDARALFERVIHTFTKEKARPLWERWSRYEYQFGDLEASLKLEKRMSEIYSAGQMFRRRRSVFSR